MIVVTGANGFIGSAMVWELNQDKCTDVIAVDTISREIRPGPLSKRTIQKFLLKDEIWDFLNQPQNQTSIKWIIHMGANSSTTETNWDHLYENNFLYTLRLFQWCAEHKVGFIYASSAATYGKGELGYNDSIDSEQLSPLNLYGNSKVIFDRWALKQSFTPPHWYGLKFFNVYGPNEYHKGSMTSVPYNAFHQIQKTGTLKLFKSYLSQYKDGEQMRDFVYVKDVTRWMLELTQRKPQSGIYNMGFGKARTWVDLGKSVFKASHKNSNIEFIDMPANLKNQYQYFTEANTTKWNSQGLSLPKWSLEDGIQDYVQSYLNHNDAWM